MRYVVVIPCAFFVVITIASIAQLYDSTSPSDFETYLTGSLNETSLRVGDAPANLLIKLWEASFYLNASHNNSALIRLDVPLPPHLEDCQTRNLKNSKLDSRDEHGEVPDWARASNGEQDLSDVVLGNLMPSIQDPQPPWVDGSDEDNLEMTRRVQRDLWLLQHPKNCEDPSVKFLLADWADSRRLGLGAQMAAMAGTFAIAVQENRVLVMGRLNRASHNACKESDFERWSCYFTSETSCTKQAAKLAQQKDSWVSGRIRRQDIEEAVWSPRIPEDWGRPWERIPPSEVVQGELIKKHKNMNYKWWKSQLVRYWTRFPSEYMCRLMNEARHQAFGEDAARMVAETLPRTWPQVPFQSSQKMETVLWSGDKPWVPRPLLSMHVRQGDKHREMTIFSFKSYMELARRLQEQYPNVRAVWLSTEMQSVIEESSSYADWKFYYTRVPRQTGATTMNTYEKSLGMEQASKNAFVNLLMAADCDYFVGTLGSTWSLFINGLRCTSGKLKRGFLSVNKDRSW